MDIKIIDKKFQIRVYVKRDFFHFSEKEFLILTVTCDQHAMFYSSISPEILRIERANNTNSTFYNAAKIIIQRIVKQINTINKNLNKLFG